MVLDDFVRGIPAFEDWSHAERIRFLAWFFHTRENRPHVGVSDLRRAYERLHLRPPSNWTQLVTQLVEKGDLVKTGGGLVLERLVRDGFEAKFGTRPSTVAVGKLLAELPSKLPSLAERDFLSEVVRCLRAEAFRSAVVMAWNLAYDHFVFWVLDKHCTAFNDRWPVRFKQHHADAKIKAVQKRDDFAEFKESQVIEICRSAGIITADLKNLLDEKLEKRNSAAHPASVVFTQTQAEAYVEDIVLNVVLKVG